MTILGKNIVIWIIIIWSSKTFVYEIYKKCIRRVSVPRDKTIKSGQNVKKIIKPITNGITKKCRWKIK